MPDLAPKRCVEMGEELIVAGGRGDVDERRERRRFETRRRRRRGRLQMLDSRRQRPVSPQRGKTCGCKTCEVIRKLSAEAQALGVIEAGWRPSLGTSDSWPRRRV